MGSVFSYFHPRKIVAIDKTRVHEDSFSGKHIECLLKFGSCYKRPTTAWKCNGITWKTKGSVQFLVYTVRGVSGEENTTWCTDRRKIQVLLRVVEVCNDRSEFCGTVHCLRPCFLMRLEGVSVPEGSWDSGTTCN